MPTLVMRQYGRSYAFGLILLVGLLVSLLAAPLLLGLFNSPKGSSSAGPANLDFGQMQLAFEPNAGQVDSNVRFIAHTNAGTMAFSPTRVMLALANSGATNDTDTSEALGSVGDPTNIETQLVEQHSGGKDRPATDFAPVFLSFEGSNPGATIGTADLLPARVSYFLGNDPNAWRSNLPTYSGITYSNLYQGIDLTYSGTGSQLKGTYIVAPSADPEQIRWHYEGTRTVSMDDAGNLQMQVMGAGAQGGGNTLIEQAPVAWQQIGEARIPVDVDYSLSAGGSIGFELGAYDPDYPLTIDPTITYSTFLGGGAQERTVAGNSMVVDADGFVYVVGSTTSADFPLNDAYQLHYHGGVDYGDAFVAKLNPNAPPDEQLVYATYLGGGSLGEVDDAGSPDVGSGDDIGQSIALDADGYIYLSGATSSTNFPLYNAYQSTYGGGDFDAFVTKLNPTGTALVYSTYLGGNDWDDAALTIDPEGEVYLAGETASTNLPMVNPYQPIMRGVYDAFVAKLSASGSELLYSTYIGGLSWDFGVDITLDASGKIYFTGSTSSIDFPTHNAFQPTGGGYVLGSFNFDAFISVLDPGRTGQQQLIYSTYMGGNIAAGSLDDLARSIAVDLTGLIYVGGAASTSDFPITPDAFQTTYGGGLSDGFAAKIDPNAEPDQQLLYSTYLGGNGVVTFSYDTEEVMGIILDGEGNVYITGRTDSPDFPLQDPIQDSFNGVNYDAFVAILDPTGSSLRFSTFLGGTGTNGGNVYTEQGSNIALDAAGQVYIFGQTDLPDFPAQNAFQADYAGGILDAFVAIIALQPVSTPTATPSEPVLTATSTPTSTPVVSDTPAEPTSTVSSTNTPVVPTSTTTPSLSPTNTPGVLTATATMSPTVCAISFSDVPPGSTFYAYIECLACRGIISGYEDGTFHPNNNVTRAQAAKIISNAANYQDVIPPDRQMFNDVPTGSTFWVYVERVALHGAISGYPCGGEGEPCPGSYFRPANNLTRGQLAKIDSTAAGYDDDIPAGQQTFNDVLPSSTFWVYVERVYLHSIIIGYPCGGEGEPCPGSYFRPQNNSTRGQISKIVANTFSPACGSTR